MANRVDPAAILGAIGVEGVTALTPVSGGMSGARLWRVGRKDQPDLLLRAMVDTDEQTFHREVSAQRFAHASGLPTPEIIHAGPIGDPPLPIIVMLWADGAPASDVMAAAPGDPDLAVALGHQSGRTLARLHALPAPADLVDDDRLEYWLHGLDDWLAERVAGPGTGRCLLHFDFHPMNLLVDDGRIATVLDWANVVVGDPRLDLGRSYACLQLGASLQADRIDRALVEGFWRGLVTGYGTPTMTLDELAPFLVAGLNSLIEDRLRHPMSDPMSDAIAELAIEREAWIGLAERASR